MQLLLVSPRECAISAFVLCLASVGCNTDVTADAGTTADDDTSGSQDSGDTDSWEPIPARGDIELTSVVVNQGVDVPIAVLGEWVGPGDRNTYVVADRDTLLRGYWEIPEDWQPRPITATLDLVYPDGTEYHDEVTVVIDGPSYPGDFERAFNFPLVAEQVPPGVTFYMQLWEAEPGWEEERESTTILTSPSEGAYQIGVQPEPAELKAVVVPVNYNAGDCNTTTADITEEEENYFLNFLHEQNPVKEVIWDFRRDTPIQWNSELTSLAQLWEPLQQMRTDDAAPPNAYYYALVNACAGGIDGAGGIAPGTPPPTKDAAYQRVSSGLWLPNNAGYSYHTYVHETGHNQGRPHVFCEGGGAAGTDPSYPHENGIIGVWGFGIRLFRFHSPTGTFDYMTYCSPNWVSDWTWTKNYNQIRTLTSWDYEGPSAQPEPTGEVLIGLLMENGEEQWWTTPGGREAAYFTGAQSVSLDYGDQSFDLPAAIEPLDDGTTMVTVQLPRPGVEFQTATRIDHGQVYPIDMQRADVQSWSIP